VKTPLIEAQVIDQAKARGIPEDRVIEDVILAAQPNKTFVQYGHLAGQLLYLVSDQGASATGGSFVIDGGWTAQ
jgi:3-hydroxybutyrate dehydrogenase